MKKLLTLALLSSLFLFAGCSNGGSGSKKVGEKISYQDATDLIDEAESILAKKEYSSRYIHKANLKDKVDFELEAKLSFDIDQTSEFVCDIDKTNDKMLLTRKMTTYGNSKGSGTDWVKDPEADVARSFRARFNASSADEFCKKMNEKSERMGNSTKYYDYSSSDDTTTIYSYGKIGVDYGTTVKTESSNYIKMYGHNDYNTMHNRIYNLIEIGFDEEWLVAYKNKDTLTIKLIDDFVYGEVDKDTLQVTNWNYSSFREFISSQFNFDRSAAMYNPNNLKFAITITLNKDGSYKSFNSSLTFDSKIINYLSYPNTTASNGAILRTFKESYADIKMNFTQTETFAYSGVKVVKPDWAKSE